MSTIRWPDKDPQEDLDYSIDWAAENRLTPGDTITQSVWQIPETADYDITTHDEEHSSTTTSIWLSGGTADQTYTLTNTIHTAGGRTHEQSVKIRVRNK